MEFVPIRLISDLEAFHPLRDGVCGVSELDREGATSMANKLTPKDLPVDIGLLEGVSSMDAHDPSSVLQVILKSLFLSGIGEIAAGTEKEDHIILFDGPGSEVIQLIANHKVKSPLIGQEGGQEFLVAGRVMPPAPHIKDLELLMVIGVERGKGDQKEESGSEAVEERVHCQSNGISGESPEFVENHTGGYGSGTGTLIRESTTECILTDCDLGSL